MTLPVTDSDAGDTITVHVPMTFRKRNGRKEIILPEGTGPIGEGAPYAPPPLALAIARAHKWQKMLDVGEVKSLEDLAAQVGVDRSYVARILRLGALAPDIVQAILAGKHPNSSSLRDLMKSLPPRWDQQRRVLDS